MNALDFDRATRVVSTQLPRRSLASLLGLGAAGLATHNLSEMASAKKNKNKKARKKAKKKCKKQKEACSEQVTAFCSQFNANAPICEATLQPCCDKCDVSTGVSCVLNASLLA